MEANSPAPALSRAFKSPGLLPGQAQLLHDAGQRLGKTKIPGDGRGLRSNHAEREKVPVVAREPWQQAGAEERGLAIARGGENDEKPGCRVVPKAAEDIQSTQDFEIASEEHRGILEIERLQAAEWGAVGFVFRWPREKVGTETCLLQTRFEPAEALGQERNRVISISMAELDRFRWDRSRRGGRAAIRRSSR